MSPKETALIRLAAGISHELNNLLMVVHGNILAMQEMEIPPQSQAIILQEVLQAARRGIELARRLQTYAGRLPLNPVALDLRRLIEQVVAQLEHTVLRDVNVRVVLPSQPCLVSLDADVAREMLTELAVNARAAMIAGGFLTFKLITISKGGTETASLKRAQFARLYLCDDGTGMSREIMENATDPLFSGQSGSEGKRGWGLSMVAGFIRQSRGRLRVGKSRAGGTRVEICLPLVDRF